MAYDATVLAGTQGMRNHQKTDRLLAGRARAAPAGGALRRGRRRPAGRRRHAHRRRPARHDLRELRAPERPGAADRHRRRPLLRRQRRAARLLRRRHRDARQLDRHGRPGDGRRRRPRRLPARGDRPERRAVARRRDRRPRRRRGRRRSPRRAAISRSSRGASRRRSPPTRRRCATLLPANRLRVYDIRAVVDALVDPSSALELRAGFGAGIVTALARIDGRPVGLIANNPMHLGGAIDADAADKAARFMQLCDAHALPLVSLIDTPGFMVGPEIESRGQVRHVSRMFVVAAQLRVPVAAIVLRKAYGLGAMAMAGGRHARADGDRRPGRAASSARWASKARSSSATARSWRRRAKATSARRCASGWSPRSTRRARRSNMAATLEIDAVIDPADSRRWLAVDPRIGAPARAGRPLHRSVVGRVGPVVRLQRGVGGLVAEGDLVAGVVGRASRSRPSAVPARYQRFTSRPIPRRSP